ncbi:hypothetical protein FS800_23180 [Agrobacterium vitis]|uniref:hypothetical protein n=1 Tax=Allorhizobium ampelinum TaxID=3025782 RepID=UPI001F211197|nr:hypothetical protein [Allorhizobium ampelinum]MCF1485035.1 hypothetical protein [Allorhizobium ampelinum]
MSNRLSITPGRMIVTKAGYDAADLSVADQNKVFDSNWGFTGLIIARGQITDPAPANGSGSEAYFTTTSAPLTITFPTVGYVPAAYVLNDYTPNANSFQSQGGVGMMCTEPVGNKFASSPPTIADGSITIPRRNHNNGNYERFTGVIRYIVFAISQ